MHFSLRHFIACILILLLPLQALAALAAVACAQELGQASMTAVVIEDCGGGHMDAQTVSAPAHHDGIPSMADDTGVSVQCAWGSHCMAIAAPALPAKNLLPQIETAFDRAAFRDQFYRSYIPDGLQRPPQFLFHSLLAKSAR